MSDWTGLLAQVESVSNTISLTVRIVAAVIGFVVGGLATGLVARLIVVATSDKKLPSGLLYFFRLLGGVATALIVFLVMSGRGGGLGLGTGSGNGSGTGPGTESPPARKDKVNPKEKDPDNEKSPGQQPLEIEVLSDDPVVKIEGNNAVAGHRYYRVRNQSGTRLLTLDEVQKLISPEGDPKWRHIILVVYDDDGGPADNVPRVRDLNKWATSLRVKAPPGNVKVTIMPRLGKTPLK